VPVEPVTTPAPATTPSKPAPVDYKDIAKGMPLDEVAAPAFDENKPAPVKTEAPKETPVEAAPKPGDVTEGEGAGTPFEKGFKQLTQKAAALRSREDAVKHLEPLSKALSPVQSAALVKALASGDPLAAMTAMGFSYADVSARVAGAPAAKPPAGKPPEQPSDEKPVADEDPEIAELKAWRREQKTATARAAIIDGIKGVVTGAGEKFKTIAALEDFEGVQSIINSMWNPEEKEFVGGATGLEVIQIAAEEYERRLASGEVALTKKQWEKLGSLTPAPASGSTPPATTRVRSGNAPVSSGSKTLTNNAGAPPSAPAATRTDPAKMYSDIAAGMPT
jgi:hypothetical protein